MTGVPVLRASRIVDPGTTSAVSGRTTRRHFLLHPDEAREMEQVYWYCLAHAAKLHGILVHAACLMSTHTHEVKKIRPKKRSDRGWQSGVAPRGVGMALSTPADPALVARIDGGKDASVTKLAFGNG